MNKFAIVSDSSCDLDKNLREKYGVDYVPFLCHYKGKDVVADPDWENMPIEEFYDYLREGNRIVTSQISVHDCREVFEKYLSQGMDVLSISCTGALSSSVNVCYRVREELKEKYPERKIICIDATISSGGISILCARASKLREEGKSIEEVAAFIEENKKFVNQEGSVNDLSYLKRAGRVSWASAFFGGLLNIKPLIIADVHGYNVAIEKVKGRKTSIIRTAERVAESINLEEYPYIFIRHSNCEDIEDVKKEILARVNIKEENINIGNINAAIGASVGPGMFGVYFVGKEVTYDSKVK